MINFLSVFFIETLFFTDLWIFLYIRIIPFLNRHFPPILPSNFIRAEVAPEPFEIPIYLLLASMMVLLISLYYKVLKSFINKSLRTKNIIFISIVKIVIFVTLFVFFIQSLGQYPMAHNIYPYQQIASLDAYHATFFIYLTCMIVILIETILLEKILKIKKWFFLLFSLFVLLLLAILLFEPRFPTYGLDYSYFIGPIWEIAHGKTIFTQVASQYGFLSILIFGLLFKLQIISLWNLPIIVWLLYILEYYLIFYLVCKISKSTILGLIGLFSVVTVNYFSSYIAPISLPQIGPMRWLPIILSLLVFYKIKRFNSTILILTLAILSFWIIDNGISIILSYLFTLFLLILTGLTNIKAAFKTAVSFCLTVFIVFFSLNIIHLGLGFKSIDITLVFLKLQQYAQAGYGMIPIEFNNYFWLVLFLYFSICIYALNKVKSHLLEKDKNILSLLLFAANLMLFTSVYFVGRSHPHNLFMIAPIFIFTSFLFISSIWPNISGKKLKILILSILFITFIAYPANERQEIMTKLFLGKITGYQQKNIFSFETKQILVNKYKKEIEMIKHNFPEEKILLLSDDDIYIFYLTNKQSYLMDDPEITILTQQDVNYSTKEVTSICPKKMVGDCRLFAKCSYSNPYVQIYAYIQPYLMQRIESICKIKYKPINCTDQLCIAQAE